MKKFYLLIALVVFSMGLRAQLTCPAFAFQYSLTSPTPHCVINVSGFPTGQAITIELVAASGALIPEFGSTNDFEVNVNPASGSASFYYDCAGPGVHHIVAKRLAANGTIEDCQVTRIIPGAAMPVKLTSFIGRLETETSADLTWTSAVEFDSYQYQVERSADGKNYVKVGTINAAGASNEIIKYQFKDVLPGSGAYYYRLKQVDIDGKFEYSKSVYINSKKGSGIVTSVFPNPFKNEIQLVGATSADLNTPGNVQLYTLAGQRMNFRIIGANAISIAENAPKGIYILKIKNGSTSQQFKLVKE
ncbi:MAG TPA: T9SS type A sorting domain-containing protein [Niastella sp.]